MTTLQRFILFLVLLPSLAHAQTRVIVTPDQVYEPPLNKTASISFDTTTNELILNPKLSSSVRIPNTLTLPAFVRAALSVGAGPITYNSSTGQFGFTPLAVADVTGLSTALSGKEPAITAGTAGQYFRHDKTFAPLNTAAVAESTNLYFTDARARLAFSGTGAINYNNTTGVVSLASSAQLPGTPTIQTQPGTSDDSPAIATTAWVKAQNYGVAGAGSNNGSNVGTAGIGIFKDINVATFRFKKVNTTSNLLTLTDDTANDEVDFTINQGNLSIAGSQVTGTIATAQTPAYTGDVTKPTSSGVTTIANNAVTNAKMAQMANGTIKGRTTAGTGNSEDLTAAQVKTILSLNNVPNTDATNASNISAGTLPAARFPAFTGDVTTGAGGVVSTIASNAVTNTKLALVPANTLKGNNQGASVNPVDLTTLQVRDMINVSNFNTTTTLSSYAGTNTKAVTDDGRSWVYEAGNSATANEGTIVVATGKGSGRWVYKAMKPMNVRDFGATGDGTTDDGPAIQRAIDAAVDACRPVQPGTNNAYRGTVGVVYIPTGHYKLTTPLSLPGSIMVMGDGRQSYGGTFLYQSNQAANMFELAPDPNGGGGNNCVLLEKLGMMHIGSATVPTKALIYAWDGSVNGFNSLYVKECWMQNGDEYLAIIGRADDVVISECTLDGTAGAGFLLGTDTYTATNVRIINNTIYNVKGTFINAYRVAGLLVQGNTIYNESAFPMGTLVDADNLNPQVFEGVVISGNTTQYVNRLLKTRFFGATVTGNVCRNMSGPAIELTQVSTITRLSVTNNQFFGDFTGSTSRPIYGPSAGLQQSIITNNLIVNTAGSAAAHAFHLPDARTNSNEISNNRLINFTAEASVVPLNGQSGAVATRSPSRLVQGDNESRTALIDNFNTDWPSGTYEAVSGATAAPIVSSLLVTISRSHGLGSATWSNAIEAVQTSTGRRFTAQNVNGTLSAWAEQLPDNRFVSGNTALTKANNIANPNTDNPSSFYTVASGSANMPDTGTWYVTRNHHENGTANSGLYWWDLATKLGTSGASVYSRIVDNGTPGSWQLIGGGASPTTNAADLTTGTLAAARMPALTGDITSTANTVGTTLATVNSNVGTFTNGTFTVNGKGLITAASSGATPLLASEKGAASGVATLDANTKIPFAQLPGGAINTQTGTTYTFVATDCNKTVRFTNSGAITATIPANVVTAGCLVNWAQKGTGVITFANGASMTFSSFSSFTKSAGQHAMGTILFDTSTTSTLGGNISN